MAYTYILGSTTFATLNESAGRKALSIAVDAPTYDRKKFHVPGVSGTYIIDAGNMERKIRATARYVGTLNDIADNFAADCATLAASAFSVTDDGGNVYTRCRLDSATRTSPVLALGTDSSTGYMDVDFSITSYA